MSLPVVIVVKEVLGNVCARFNWIAVKGIGDKCASFASTFNLTDSTAACHALPVQSADPTPLRLAL
jgi:hypothetical protein